VTSLRYTTGEPAAEIAMLPEVIVDTTCGKDITPGPVIPSPSRAAVTGYRQSPQLDVAAYAELLHRVSAMVEDIPEITELDLNPVFVARHGAVIADIRVRLTG
jgi:hypothetical protein